MQCVDCVQEGRRTTRPARTVGGARVSHRSSRPLVVPALIAVNVAVFVLTVVDARSVSANSDGAVFAATSLVPYTVAGGQWWRLVTSGFLHIGPLHLAFNMVALWVIGRDVERVLGPLRFGAVYTAALLGGSTAVMLLGAPTGAVAGASGAVFGLMGALVVLLRRMRLSPGPALAVIGVNVVLSVVLPGVSILAHLGGLAVGALVAAGFVHGPARSRPAAGFVLAGVVVVALLVLVGLRDLTLGPVVCDALGTCRPG